MNDKCKYCKEPSALIWLDRRVCIDHWFEICRLGKMKFLKKYEPKFARKYEMEQTKRELRDFVEDLLSDGRKARQIIIVADNSCWKGLETEILQILKTFFPKIKKRFKEL